MSGDWSLHPRLAADSYAVASLALSDVRLMGNAHYPWLVLVPRVAGAVEWVDLDSDARHRLLDEATQCAEALRRLAPVDKLNIGAIGNIVDQLHLHVVARTRGDAAWPAPVWGGPSVPYEATAREARLARLRELLAAT